MCKRYFKFHTKTLFLSHWKCRILFDRFKRQSFLYRIVNDDEKWIHFDNPKRKKSWLDHSQPSTSQPVRNIHGKKALLCIWWDQKGAVYYEVLKPGETVTGDRYRQQLIKLNQALKRKRPKWGNRTHKVILLHDNARTMLRNQSKHIWKILNGTCYLTRRIHQT